VRAADHPVLLGLDRLHDVGHPPGPAGLQRGQQRRLAGRPTGPGRVPGMPVEHLVVHRDYLAQPGPDVPPAPHAVGRDRGGDVERPRRRRPPVHQQQVVVAVVIHDPEPPDVPALAVLEVQPAEAQAVLGRVELPDPVREPGRDAVPLRHGLVGAAGRGQHLGQPVRGPRPEPVQPPVQHRHVRLLAGQFRR
jgi:hypothetical protein